MWDLCKHEIRVSTIIVYSSTINKHKPKFAELEKKIDAIRIKLSKNNTKEKQELFIKTKLELEIAWNKNTEGAKVRSKKQWIQEGENNTTYFVNLKKRIVVNKTIIYFCVNRMVVSYYKSLYQQNEAVDIIVVSTFLSKI